MSDDPGQQRRRMVERLRSELGIADERVLTAMMTVPRHHFVDDGPLASHAYSLHALPIGEEQTISKPGVVARMTELLEVGEEDSVLEIGTGSGYQTAILAELAKRVYSLEIVPALARQALGRIRARGYTNVKIQIFDGTVGWSEVAPFDRILVTAGAPSLPAPLLAQLAEGGRLLIPEGERDRQHLVIYERAGDKVRREVKDEASFVPLTGRHGWEEKVESR